MHLIHKGEFQHSATNGAKMRLVRNTICLSLFLFLLLSITACTTKGAKVGYEWMDTVGLKDQRYAKACGPAKKFGAPAVDVRAGSKPRPRDIYEANRLGESPTDKFWYEGVQGVVMQPMRAEPRAALCPIAGKVEMRRPDPAQDREFNQKYSPPGLRFASPKSTAIEGVPTRPGRYTTNVVLCGRCEFATYVEYPLVFTIDWVIEGSVPRRLD